jgi:NAD(P)-dependent dehydrogenase (short-subunit alcohol dehydrogenase family)
MTTARHGALVVFGSGPGIGVHVAARFARGGFEKVILLSRDAARLRNDAFIVYSNAPQVEVSTVAADLASPADLQRALRRIGDILGDTPVECIHYNAAKASRTFILDESAADLRANLEVRADTSRDIVRYEAITNTSLRSPWSVFILC